MRLFVVGASGGVGSRLLTRAVAQGHTVTAQTREANRVAPSDEVRVAVGAPTDESFLRQSLEGHDAVVLCLGIDSLGRTTLFSDSTRALIAAMEATGVKRLVAVTGIGAGDSKGHGGWYYNHVLFPLFTRHRYADKDRQEALIEGTSLDWTIVRPAPFAKSAPDGALQVFTEIPPGLQLSAITRDETAAFLLECVENATFVRQKPFIGHP